MINRVVLVGRLTADPSLRYTPNGVPVANFTLAVNRPFTNQQGEREADFVNIVVWRKAAENVSNFLSKGSLAGIDGRLQTRSYDNDEGKRIYITEVIADSVQFLEPKKDGQAATNGNGPNNGSNHPGNTNVGNDNKNAGNGQNGGRGPSTNPFDYDDDPFKNDGKPIDISDDDLPF